MISPRVQIPGLSKGTADGRYIQLPTSGDRTFYVATTGNNTTGDGSVSKPWATIQYALNQLTRYRTAGTLIIDVADGTYVENIDVPSGIVGEVKLQGDNANPNNVVIDGSGGTIFNSTQNGTNILIDGFRLTDGIFGMLLDAAYVRIGKIFMDDVTYGVIATNTQSTIFLSGYGDSTIACDGTNGSTAVIFNNQSNIIIQQNLTCTNFDEGLRSTDSSTLNCQFNKTITLTQRAAGGDGCISIKDNSTALIYSNLVLNGSTKTATNWGIEVQGSTLATFSGMTVTMSNLEFGIKGIYDNQIISPAATWTYTNVDRPVVLNYATTYFSPDSFDTTIEFDDLESESYAFDSRYLMLDGSNDPITGDITLNDDVGLNFGTGSITETLWNTTDANANHLMTNLPTGGAVDVPVWAMGIGIIGTDQGLFNGYTDPTLVIFDDDASDRLEIGWKENLAGLAAGDGMAITNPNGNVMIGTGGTIVRFQPTQTGSSLRALFASSNTSGNAGFELQTTASLFFMRAMFNFAEALLVTSSNVGGQVLIVDTSTRDNDHDIVPQSNPLLGIASILNPNTDNGEKITATFLGVRAGAVDNADWVSSSFSMQTDRATYDMTIGAVNARQNASSQTNKTGGSLNLRAGDGNILDLTSGVGGHVNLIPGSQDDDNNGEPGRVQVDLPQTTAQPRVGGVLHTNTTSVGNVGAGEDDLMTYSLPAFTLQKTGDTVRITSGGDFGANGNNKEVKLYFGGRAIADTQVGTPNGTSWRVVAEVTRTGATAQVATSYIGTDGTSFQDHAETTFPAETLANAITIKCTGEATADNDIEQKLFIIEYLPANS